MMALKLCLYLLCPTDSNVFDTQQKNMSPFDTSDVCADLYTIYVFFFSTLESLT